MESLTKMGDTNFQSLFFESLCLRSKGRRARLVKLVANLVPVASVGFYARCFKFQSYSVSWKHDGDGRQVSGGIGVSFRRVIY